MREATGNALLTMIVAATITIIMVFFVGTLSYSKSYKIKNYIIDQIEENKGWSSTLESSIDEHLKDVGYNIRGDLNCNSSNNLPKSGWCKSISLSSSYNYCIYECVNGSYTYYTVLTFMKFDFPVISESLKIRVYGSTKNIRSNTVNYFN